MDFVEKKRKRKRNGVVSKRFQYKLICLIFFLIIVMMKIVSYTCQDLTGSVSNKGVPKTVFSMSVNDLWPCSGISNCYYQKNSINCTKMTKLSIILNFNEEGGLKPPPLIAALSTAMKKNRRGLLKGAYFEMDQNRPLELIVCDKRVDMLQWAKTSVIANTSLPPSSRMVFSIVDPDSKRAQKIKTAVLEFSSIFIVIFNNPPECVLVDDFNHKIFWSDSNRGTIEAYDTKTNKMIILAKSSNMPGSMAIDPTLRLLFWCNFKIIGSIERINFDGGNRMEITKGKYVLVYPEKLGIDRTHRMLYWTEHGVIHTSDYNGDYHKVVQKSDAYDPNFPGCFSFAADTVEHNFFWENRPLQHFNRSFVPNHLVSISYRKNGKKALNNMKLPTVFHEQPNLEHIKWRTLNMTCPKPIPKSHHCILLPVPLNTSFSYIRDNRTLSMTGYKLVKLYNMSKFLDQKDLGIKWYYFNSKTHTVVYYDPKTKHIRFLFYVIRDMNYTVMYKYKYSHVISYIFENINMFTSDLIIFDPTEKSFYLLNTTKNSTKRFNINGNNSRTSSSPRIFSYVTEVMDYNNNAQSHTYAIQKYVLMTVFKVILQSLIVHFVIIPFAMEKNVFVLFLQLSFYITFNKLVTIILIQFS